MRQRLLRLETDFEFGVAFGLDVVGHVTTVDGNDDLQIARSGLAGVDYKVNSHVQICRESVHGGRPTGSTYC